MCGIVGGIAERNVLPILLEGLKRLEYRGYDSSGVALLAVDGQIRRARALGKIRALEEKIASMPADSVAGMQGIAHTRWATHGKPAENNAHPHICNNQVAVVHNGIIENYLQLKSEQLTAGFRFTSETDTEVVAHEVYAWHNGASSLDLLTSVQKAISRFHGAYALGVMSVKEPGRLIAARKGSPLVIGVGIGEYFIASDVSALLPVTQQFIFLEEGDVADIRRDSLTIYDVNGSQVDRAIKQSKLSLHSIELGEHQHYMHKEIFEQPKAVLDTLESRISQGQVLVQSFGVEAEAIFAKIKRVQIVACGTSFHAGLVAKYWLEDILSLPCAVEVASEYRYRNPVIETDTLFVAVSQSGETADTLAALQQIKQLAKQRGNLFVPSLTICNVPESSLTRECDLVFLTHAGPEIGVASTKAFTTQLVALSLMLLSIGKIQGRLAEGQEQRIVGGLSRLPSLIDQALSQESLIKKLAEQFIDKHSALFLGRGAMYPIAMEGALKLKEISYIHAEAYPAGELKHGPLALIDDQIPVIAIAPNNDLLEKLKSNLQEVRARGGNMIVFEDHAAELSKQAEAGMQVVQTITSVGRITAPVVFNVALQLLAYHVALIKGTDVDQPRNLAKSVTVE